MLFRFLGIQLCLTLIRGMASFLGSVLGTNLGPGLGGQSRGHAAPFQTLTL